eukprot:Skav206606  [mRNA]  locus=scaffold332:154999:156945:- [translate_table: standard]
MLFRSAEEVGAESGSGSGEVLLAAEHVTVTKATMADWEELQERRGVALWLQLLEMNEHLQAVEMRNMEEPSPAEIRPMRPGKSQPIGP